MTKTSIKPIKRSQSEYNYSRQCGNVQIKNGVSNIAYIEYNIRDEVYKRTKEAARCYAVMANIPMMLNKLYSTINYELKSYPYLSK